MMAIELKCQSCGMLYSLGSDTKVNTALPTPRGPKDKSMSRDFLLLHAAWGNEDLPDDFWFLPDPDFREYGPDKPYPREHAFGTPWSRMVSKWREEAELELARLVFLLSTGNPRHWKCPKCGAVQLYPPLASFVPK